MTSVPGGTRLNRESLSKDHTLHYTVLVTLDNDLG